jgi:hypothetical protein
MPVSGISRQDHSRTQVVVILHLGTLGVVGGDIHLRNNTDIFPVSGKTRKVIGRIESFSIPVVDAKDRAQNRKPAFCSPLTGLIYQSAEFWNSNGRQNTDNGDNYHQLDQGKRLPKFPGFIFHASFSQLKKVFRLPRLIRLMDYTIAAEGGQLPAGLYNLF